MAHNSPVHSIHLQRKYFTSRCTCSTKRWPGFGSAVIDAEYQADQIKYWFGIDDETYIVPPPGSRYEYADGVPVLLSEYGVPQ